jgi:hypothetical protein
MIERSLEVPTIITPIANYDDSQHSFNENIRLRNLWDGIDLMAALFLCADLAPALNRAGMGFHGRPPSAPCHTHRIALPYSAFSTQTSITPFPPPISLPYQQPPKNRAAVRPTLVLSRLRGPPCQLYQ